MRLACLLVSLLFCCRSLFGQTAGEDEFSFFESRIRPLLARHCLDCHGGEKTKGGLSLENRESLLKGGNSGPAIIPGQPENSILINAVRREDLEMPPDQELSPQEIADLETWVRSGAPDPRTSSLKIGGMSAESAGSWWSFQPLAKPAIRLSTEAVDNLIERQLSDQQLTPLPAADKRSLLRRANYDLTGLPPTAAEVEAFLADESPEAFSRVVDRLLDSPQYGVHWGRHWLDVVRYADTAGENTDRPLPHAWRYRNWVFDSFQSDLPFDQFTRLQIAGDLVGAASSESERQAGLVATGYLAIARRFGHDTDQDIHLMYEDVIDNLGKNFLGLTLGCARCHDHKYDPVTAEDYYALYGIFSSSKFSFSGCEARGQPKDLVPLLSAEASERLLQPWRAEIARIQQQNTERQLAVEREVKSFRELIAPQQQLLASGKVDEGGESQLAAENHQPLNALRVRRGEVLLLAILPNGNHGADSTLVDWTISAEDDPALSWRSSDLTADLLAGNPHEGTAGARWLFLQYADSIPKPLSEQRPTNGGSESIQSWSIGSEPSLFANLSDQAVPTWTTLPAKSLFLHPGDQRPAALAWIAPRDGVFNISGRIVDVHLAAGLDGVSYELIHFADQSAGPRILSIFESEQRPIVAAPAQPTLPVAYAVVEGTIGNARLQQRGEPEQLGDEVPRRWLSVLDGATLPPDAGSGRRELAEWIIASPLFTRVLANRIWQWHFGRGLVRTPSDFGSRGELPTHPELLEALAAELVAGGYQLKPLHRLIMLTDAYQRGSLGSPQLAERDPENRWLATYSRRRLTAEELRDSLLQASGQLDPTPAEAHPFPPEASWGFTQHEPFNAVYETHKRSAYLMVQRQRRHPFLALFDGADPNASTPLRQQTNVSTQALYFLNDPFFHEQAQLIAAELLKHSAAERPSELYRGLLQRSPTEPEQAKLAALVEQYPGSEQEKWAAAARVVMASNEFLFVD